MTKLLFDACLPRSLPMELRDLAVRLGLPIPEMISLHDLDDGDALDEDWVPRAATGGWVVISKDVGKRRRGKGLQLKIVCEQHRVTSIICSQSVGKRKTVDLTITLLSVWREICRCLDAPAGTAFRIDPSSGQVEADSGSGRIVKTKDPSPT